MYNSNKILSNNLNAPHTPINTRDGELPDILVSTMNKIIQDNESNQFIDGTTGRIGYPLWTKSTVIGTGDGSRHIMYVPFAKEDEQNTQAFLIATKDYNFPSEEVKINIRLSSDIEKMESGELSYTGNSCQDVILFQTFDKYLYQSEDKRFEDAFCSSCFEDHPNIQSNIATQRECVDVELVICFDDYGIFGNPSTNGGAGGWSITGDGGGFSGPGFAVFGHFASAPASDTGFGGLWSAIASFFGSAGGAAGNFWDWVIDVFTPDPVCPWDLAPDTTADTRGEGDYACQTYIVYLCSQGDWWEVVESVPCDNCGGNVTREEYYKKACTNNAIEFLNTYGIGLMDWKKADGPNADCCNEVGEFDEECAKNTLFIYELSLYDDVTQLIIQDYQNTGIKKVYYNKYGHGGLLQYVSGYWIYERSPGWMEGEVTVHFIYINEKWELYEPAEFPPEMQFISTLANSLLGGGHLALDLFGLIPVAGEIADGINAVWYYSEGDLVNGALSTASMIPVLGYGANAAKWARNTLRLSDGAFHSAEGLQFARRFYGSLGLTESALTHVYRHKVDDLAKQFHGIFKHPDDIIGVMDDAFKKLNQGSSDVLIDVIQSDGNRKVVVEMIDIIGKKGGFNGDGSDLTKLTIIFEGNTTKIITSFPN